MKVAIGGLLPVQNRELEKRFGHRADLRFLTTDSGPSTWEQACQHMDSVIVSTKFVSHPHDRAIPEEKRVRVHGALSAISRELDKLLPLSHRETTNKSLVDEPAQNQTNPEEAPVAKHRNTGKSAQVYKFLSQLTPGQVVEGSWINEKIGLHRHNGIAYTVMKTLAQRGYLKSPKRGKFIITDETAKLATLQTHPGVAIPFVNGTAPAATATADVAKLIADGKGAVAQLQRYISSVRMLAANIEALLPKLIREGKPGSTKKLDLAAIPTKKLWDEITTRQLEKKTRPKNSKAKA